jgi:hypothetical protein
VVASHPDRWVPWTHRDTHKDTHRDTCRNSIELDANHRNSYCRFCVWLVGLGLAVFRVRQGWVWLCLGSGQVRSSHVWLHLGLSEVGLVMVQISQG